MKADRVQFLVAELFDLGITEFNISFEASQPLIGIEKLQERLADCGAEAEWVGGTESESTFRVKEII